MKNTILSLAIAAGLLVPIPQVRAESSNHDAKTQKNKGNNLSNVQMYSAARGSASGSDWMALVEDSRSVGSLTIPGTHDSMALHETILSSAQCQWFTLRDQLHMGVRCLDIRCRHMKDGFAIHHGMEYQHANFTDVLTTCQQFLKEHPKETILMIVKREYDDEPGITRSFAETFMSYVGKFPDLFALKTTHVPVLNNEIRGKIVLIRRFDEKETVYTKWVLGPGFLPKLVPDKNSAKEVNVQVGGIDASHWPDNPETVVPVGDAIQLEDCYDLGDYFWPVAPWNYKWSIIQKGLDAAAQDPEGKYLHLTFTSGVAFNKVGQPFIRTVSDDINPRLDAFFTKNPKGHYGTILMDFAWAEIVRKIYSVNFAN